jgi:phosphohistidine phosphatase SixA
MRVVLVRHGEKAALDNVEDDRQPLSSDGEQQVRSLARILRRLDVRPDIYLTSKHEHAVATAALLASQLSEPAIADVKQVAALTPRSTTSTFEEILEEAETLGVPFRDFREVALVGHEPRLNQLITRLTRTVGRARCAQTPRLGPHLVVSRRCSCGRR